MSTETAALAVIPKNLEVAIQQRGIDQFTWKTLSETLYRGAAPESIIMVLDYCKARRLDPLKRVCHIVPIWDSKAKKLVDTIWQGIAEIRTTAMRTKEYAGIDETVYGADITKKIGTTDISFPEWAQVTVYRIINGIRVPFVGDKVYFTEYYAVKSKDDKTPNSMWTTKPRSQLSKCAEANALRKAFPEELGNEYISDEIRTYEPKQTIERIANPFETKAEVEDVQPVIEVDYTKNEEEPNDSLQCEHCGVSIPQVVNDYSMDVFKTPLCMKCQKLKKNGEI